MITSTWKAAPINLQADGSTLATVSPKIRDGVSLATDRAKENIRRREDIDRLLENTNANLRELVSVSKYFYSESLIYARLVDYFSKMLPYYWYITPRIGTQDALKKLWTVLDFVETINPEIIGPDIAQRVIRDGSCYIAVKERLKGNDYTFGLQYLEPEYCRSNKTYNGRKMVMFNTAFFDEKYPNKEIRDLVLSTYPECVSEAYYKTHSPGYQKTNLANDYWIDLDQNYAFKFSVRPDDLPYFLGTIKDLYGLEDVKNMSLVKFERDLSTILVQKFETDEDGHPNLSLPEMVAYHKDVAGAIQNIPGMDLITTFASIDKLDIHSRTQESGTNNPVKNKTEEIYSSAGISQIIFNADSAGALGKATVADEAIMYSLLHQMATFLQVRLDVNFRTKGYEPLKLKVSMPEISHMNKEALAKIYREQANFGASKILPGVALGIRQSVILASGIFEQGIDIDSILASPGAQQAIKTQEARQSANPSQPKAPAGSTNKGGRPPKADEERADKTGANRENLDGGS